MFEKLIEYKEMREAIQRVRELAKSYERSGDEDHWTVAQEIYIALQDKK
jgi:hypothetical protein